MVILLIYRRLRSRFVSTCPLSELSSPHPALTTIRREDLNVELPPYPSLLQPKDVLFRRYPSVYLPKDVLFYRYPSAHLSKDTFFSLSFDSGWSVKSSLSVKSYVDCIRF